MGGNGQILRLAGLEILLSAWRWTQIPPTTAAPFPGEPHCPQAAEQDQDGHPHPQRESVFIIITPPALLTPAKHLLIFSFNPHHSLHVTEEQTELSEVREFTQDPQQHRPGDCEPRFPGMKFASLTPSPIDVLNGPGYCGKDLRSPSSPSVA